MRLIRLTTSKDVIPSFALSLTQVSWSKMINCIDGTSEEISLRKDEMIEINDIASDNNNLLPTDLLSTMKSQDLMSLAY